MFLGGLSLAISAAVPAQAPIPVAVSSAAQEQMARRLASAVVKGFRSDARFRLVDGTAPGVLNISMPTGVGWERRVDWTEIHYQARLSSASGRSRVIAGHCWNWNLSVCAKQIVDAAAAMTGN